MCEEYSSQNYSTGNFIVFRGFVYTMLIAE